MEPEIDEYLQSHFFCRQ